jgi:molybdopterin/thiamine biosynthesis adenylyltransferase
MTETERVLEMIENFEKGQDRGRGLVIDKKSKKFREASPYDDPDQVIKVTPEDTRFAAAQGAGPKKVIISGELLQMRMAEEEPLDVSFLSRVHSEVYSLLSDGYPTEKVPGTIYRTSGKDDIPASVFGKAEDCVRVICRLADNCGRQSPKPSTKARGYILRGEEWVETGVEILPVRSEIFSRNGGLIETDVIAGKRVLIIGLGSVGSHIAIELAKSGVMNFFLIDHDRLEVGNVVRHVADLSHVGMFKNRATAQLIKNKNPDAEIQTLEEKVCWENIEHLRKAVQWADIGVCSTDNRPSRLVTNMLFVEEGKPCLFPGAFRRAYGGQIIFVHPGKSICYQCFCMLLPDQAQDEEISSPEQAEGLAYTDRPVPIEPGLSTDIGPISLMAVKLVIQELLKGAPTTLRSLDDDLVAPWYLWLNRREPGTQFEKLDPLQFNVDGMHILRWYGIDVKRHPGCPVCGDFEGEIAKREGIQLPDAGD